MNYISYYWECICLSNVCQESGHHSHFTLADRLILMGSQSPQWLFACWDKHLQLFGWKNKTKKHKKNPERTLICSTFSTSAGYRSRQNNYADDCQRTEGMSSFELPEWFHRPKRKSVSDKRGQICGVDTHCPLLMNTERISNCASVHIRRYTALLNGCIHLNYNSHMLK